MMEGFTDGSKVRKKSVKSKVSLRSYLFSLLD